MEPIDLSKIDDLTILKALAYDQIAIKEEAARNLDHINNRIIQVKQTQDAQTQKAPNERSSASES